VISPLLSRSLMLTLRPLDDAAVGRLLDRAMESERGLAGQFVLADEARDFIVRIAGADARRSLTVLEAAAGIAAAQATTETGDEVREDVSADGEAASAGEDEADVDQTILITAEACAEASSETVLRYDRNGDQHYDVVSAFIKSIRGSHWSKRPPLARWRRSRTPATGHSTPPSPMSRTVWPSRCRPICATPTIPARSNSATGRATNTPTATRTGWPIRSICPRRCGASATTTRARTAWSAPWPSGWRTSTASCDPEHPSRRSNRECAVIGDCDGVVLTQTR